MYICMIQPYEIKKLENLDFIQKNKINENDFNK